GEHPRRVRHRDVAGQLDRRLGPPSLDDSHELRKPPLRGHADRWRGARARAVLDRGACDARPQSRRGGERRRPTRLVRRAAQRLRRLLIAIAVSLFAFAASAMTLDEYIASLEKI